ncbi:hypothetical protein QSU92_04910 [Microbacterium sp. ET2]|uniref:hypothetical protein n=1 Tax=Microbacterium albipurpureum TaxID=3050384 RepID=UPI00259C871D|nr:hypothetical protein [Microbacterium sp. ET2 (Ac-2212)]WJL96525.1 hypothetical protein QSU92_04910 [Microbacterium sp. ET2 (Ac-2212)]
MEFRGVVPMDAPDPSVASEERLRSIAFPVLQLVPQPTLARMPITGFAESTGTGGLAHQTVSFSYTLWRYPDDRSDPRNEVELDAATRRAIDEEPPWGRPAWLIEQAQLFRYPMVSEAVRTTWHADPSAPHASLETQLVHHMNHVLRNRFREELGLPAGPTRDRSWQVRPSGVVPGTVRVDGREVDGITVDTDPFVIGTGVRVDPQVVCTVVLAREDMSFIDMALETLRTPA